jgi:hypothetical protein
MNSHTSADPDMLIVAARVWGPPRTDLGAVSRRPPLLDITPSAPYFELVKSIPDVVAEQLRITGTVRTFAQEGVVR